MSQISPIDAVISWVDGRDPEHIKTRAKYHAIHMAQDTPKTERPLSAEVNAARRWSYADELDICLRSIHANAPWIRQIFVVTNGQNPKGLDTLPAPLQAKIKIIHHEVIFDDHLEWLPTFNSMAIEAMMWKIPNLAERFLYFNDDMFVASPCEPSTFFPEAGQKTTLLGRWMSVPNSQVTKFKKSIYRSAKLNAADVMGYANTRFFSCAHVAMPMRVSALKAIYDKSPELLSHNGSKPFRGEDQYLVQGLLAHHIINIGAALINKSAISQNLSASYCKTVPFWLFWLNCGLMRIWPKRFQLICVNDLSLLNERFNGKADRIIRKAIGIL